MIFTGINMKTESIAKWLSQPVQLIELQLIVLHNIEYSADMYIHTVCAYVCVCVCAFILQVAFHFGKVAAGDEVASALAKLY